MKFVFDCLFPLRRDHAYADYAYDDSRQETGVMGHGRVQVETSGSGLWHKADKTQVLSAPHQGVRHASLRRQLMAGILLPVLLSYGGAKERVKKEDV